MNDYKIPNMGWLETSFAKKSSLSKNFEGKPRFYFVHSYHFHLKNENDILCYSNYGYNFPAGFENKNIIGLQFHPEKSHNYGKQIIENFLNI